MKTSADRWEEFINDPELNDASKHSILPNGEYLFRKISHDVLECLNAILGYINVSTTVKVWGEAEDRLRLSESVIAWLKRKKPLMETWVSEISSLVLDQEQTDWKNLIAKIGGIVSGANELQIEYQNLLNSTAASPWPMDKTIARIISRLCLLLEDIENQNYKRLWVITSYSDLIDNTDHTP